MLCLSKVRTVIAVLYSLLFILPCASGRTICIKSQQDFDGLNQRLKDVFDKENRTITVKFKPGVYYFDDEQLSFSNINLPSTSIIIKGIGVTLVPRGKDYHDGDLFEGNFSPHLSVVDITSNSDISFWEDARVAESRLELVDAKSNLWRLKCSTLTDLSKAECRGVYVIITCWYTSYTLKVDHIEGGYLYFLCAKQDYNSDYKCYFIDSDYGYAKRFPRFKLCNYRDNAEFSIDKNGRVAIHNGSTAVHVCEAGVIVNVSDCNIKSLRISGLRFLGASSNNNNTYLLKFSNIKTNDLLIKDCIFEGMKSHVVGIEGSDNLHFEKNTISNCYRGGVHIDNNSKNAHVINNNISYCGLALQQDLAISIKGEDYKVSKNEIFNYGYAAIGAGVWHGNIMKNPSSGIIENNEIYLTHDYLQRIDNYGLMDGGAIYVSTQNESVIIRGNYIHDIGGIKDNRGIFCDDGACNVTICSNIITNIQNCFSIDSRRVSAYEEKVGPTNVGNVIKDNIIDGRIRFEGREGDNNSCELGTNYFLVSNYQKPLNNIYLNLPSSNKEAVLVKDETTKTNVKVRARDFRSLKNCPSWQFWKVWIK